MQDMIPTANEIVARAAAEMFGKPFLTNVHRAAVVEAIVAAALEPDWTWCSDDYASCDFRHKVSGARLEVKQSASLQSWNAKDRKQSRCSFDVRERTGEWIDGVKWVERRGRNAGWLPRRSAAKGPEAGEHSAGWSARRAFCGG
jgi:hypothetical protein